MERCGLEVLDVENLRRHYALTLDCWGERFDMVRVEKKAGIRESHRSCNIPSLSPSGRSIRQARRTAVRGEHFAVDRLHRGDSEEPEYLFRQGA